MTSTEFELLISAVTILAAWFIGNKSVWGQRLSFLANIFWWIYVIAYQRYGLIPLQVMFLVIGIRNLIKWENEK